MAAASATQFVTTCPCAACAMGFRADGGAPPQPEAFAASKGKWGASNPSGTFGGVVTWSVMDAGLSDSTGTTFNGNTVSMQTELTFDYKALIRAAFTAWAQVANIAFVETADGGGAFGDDADAMIRIGMADLTIGGDVLGLAYLPTEGGGYVQDPLPGDIALDQRPAGYWDSTNFYLVTLHEIGHTLGLNHEDTAVAVMNAAINLGLFGTGPDGTSLQADDIAGVQSLYGSANDQLKPLILEAGRANFSVLGSTGNVLVFGNALDNQISGSTSADRIIGAAGADSIGGGDGNDLLIGDFTAANSPGISLGAGAVTKSSADAIGSIATARDLSALFSLSASANIEAATLTPHVTVTASGGDAADYYKVVINNPGAVITVDIDSTSMVGGGSTLDTYAEIWSADGTLLAEFDDSLTTFGGSGSINVQDSYLNFRAPVAGSYFIAIGVFSSAGIQPLPAAGRYTMHVSVAGELPTGEGADTLDGGLGSDTIDGGAGADSMNGGDGVDLLSYASSTSGAGILFYMLAPNLNGGDATGDVYALFENLTGTSANDRIYMDNGANSVEGGGGAFDTVELYGGNDSYTGGSGFDYVLAGAGNDVINVGDGGSLIYGEDGDDAITATAGSNNLNGGIGNDTLTGGSGQDVILGGAGLDSILGGSGDDFLFGEDGNDTISGDAGNDQIQGGIGLDSLSGGANVDVIQGGADADSIDGGSEDDFLFGEAGNDTVLGGTGNDQVFGGSENDSLVGNAGIDILNGGDGNDTLNDGGVGELTFSIGGNGNDTIFGTSGQDQMWGGTGSLDTGSDVFVFGAGNGYDIIFDFQAGPGIGDQIRLLGTGITSFAQLQAENRIGQAGANTQINLPGAGNVIFLMNTTAATLVADDFLFA